MLRWHPALPALASMVISATLSGVLAAQSIPATDYGAAVALYRSGRPREAIAALARIDRIRTRQGAEDFVQRRSQLGRAILVSAALLHLDAGAGDRAAPRRPEFAWQTDLAIRLLTAVDDMPGVKGRDDASAGLRGTRAVASMMLDDVSGRDARVYAERALSKFGNDGPLLTIAGIACETEGTGRWDVYSTSGRRMAFAWEHGYLHDARQYLDRAIAASPDGFEAQVHLAHVDVLENDDHAADDRLSRLLTRDPPAVWAYLTHLQRGEIRLRAGDRTGAQSEIDAALQLFPDAQSGLVTLSALLYRADDRLGAARVVERLLGGGRTIEAADPWWDYRFGHWKAAETWLEPLRAEARP